MYTEKCTTVLFLQFFVLTLLVLSQNAESKTRLAWYRGERKSKIAPPLLRLLRKEWWTKNRGKWKALFPWFFLAWTTTTEKWAGVHSSCLIYSLSWMKKRHKQASVSTASLSKTTSDSCNVSRTITLAGLEIKILTMTTWWRWYAMFCCCRRFYLSASSGGGGIGITLSEKKRTHSHNQVYKKSEQPKEWRINVFL